MNTICLKLTFLSLFIINTQIASAAYPEDDGGSMYYIHFPISQSPESTIQDDGEDYYENPYSAMNSMISVNCIEQGLKTYDAYKTTSDKNFTECTKKISKDFVYLLNGYQPKDSSSAPSPQYKTTLTILETIKNRFKSITGNDLTELYDSK